MLELVAKYGTDAWTVVASELGSRTPKQCRNRYMLFLAPEVNKSAWTPEEDELLKRHYAEIGPRWAVLRAFFPGRTDLNIKNRFGLLSRNNTEVRELKRKYMADHKLETSDDDVLGGRRRQDGKAEDDFERVDAEGNPITIDTLFQTLPYYMKRCLLLEGLLQHNQIPVPPEGICDVKQWMRKTIPLLPEDDQLPPIPDPTVGKN